MNRYKTAKIVKIKKETPTVKTFITDLNISANPGQYVMVWIPRINEKPFGVLYNKPLTLSIANVGSFSQKMHELKVGDKIRFRGPYGNSFSKRGGKSLFVGGGFGVVPLYFFAQSFPKTQRKNITLVLGAKTKEDLILVQDFKKMGVKVQVSTDDGSLGFKGFSTDLAEKLLGKYKFNSIYTSGPDIMMQKIAGLALSNRIFCEVSAGTFFKCGGIGLCGECAHNGRLVCKEGTIFNAKIYLGK